jgi:hypothetical protein
MSNVTINTYINITTNRVNIDTVKILIKDYFTSPAPHVSKIHYNLHLHHSTLARQLSKTHILEGVQENSKR